MSPRSPFCKSQKVINWAVQALNCRTELCDVMKFFVLKKKVSFSTFKRKKWGKRCLWLYYLNVCTVEGWFISASYICGLIATHFKRFCFWKTFLVSYSNHHFSESAFEALFFYFSLSFLALFWNCRKELFDSTATCFMENELSLKEILQGLVKQCEKA